MKGYRPIAAKLQFRENVCDYSPARPDPSPMNAPEPTPLSIAVNAEQRVSALLQQPPEPLACCVLAHGAGAGMAHAFMGRAAAGLVKRGIGCLRYQFPFMERGSKRPDLPALAHATVRAAVAEAARRLPGLPLLAAGKSFGGRMSSQAQAGEPLPGVRGLVFFGFPLHPAGKPGVERADHLAKVDCPMLFLQGSRDELAELPLLRPVIAGLGERATLEVLDGADHAFHVLTRSGRSDAQVLDQALDALARWLTEIAPETAR